MAFLVLTKAGVHDLLATPVHAGALVCINPAAVTAQDLDRLRAAGANVRLLGASVNADDDGEVAAILRELERSEGVVWLERGRPSAAQAAVQEAAPSAAAGGGPSPLRMAAGRAWRFIGQTLGREKAMMIVPYMGYGNAAMLHVRGRVLNENPFTVHSREDSAWRNFAAFYQRLESDQVRGITVRATFEGKQVEVVSDHGGYFHIDLAPDKPLARSGWHAVELELVRAGDAAPVRATAEVLVPPASARFGVISDIDDTVLWTNVTNKLNMVLTLTRSNPFTRKPFKGVAAFYRALHEGANGAEANPVFYVSSSPWHLFDPLVEFMRLQRIPVGPLMLRELNVREFFKSEHSRSHKLDKIEAIIRTYPELPFVLIGDSGERDPEIYAEVLRRHPKSVRVIYIRNVNPDPARIDAVDRLTEQVSASGAQLVLAADSVTAAAHAAAEGLIKTEALAQVRSDKIQEENSQ